MQQQAQQQQPQTTGVVQSSSLRPGVPQSINSVVRPMSAVQQQNLRSHSPGMSQLGLPGMSGMQQNQRMQFNQQAQQLQAQQVQAQQQAQAQQQQGMMVGPAGPSPNGQTNQMVPNPGLSPFGQLQMSSQANLTTTTTVTTSQFPTSNGTSTGLSNSSPIHNQNQFSEIMKVRLAAAAAQQQQQQQLQQTQPTSTSGQNVTGVTSIPQAPSPFSSMQQQQNQQFLVSRPLSSTTPNDNVMSVSTPQTIPPPASSGPSPRSTTPLANGPQSTTSTPNTPLVSSLLTPSQIAGANQTPPRPGTTPSPANHGKGMSAQERAALNAPRSSSMSSQMAAITAAFDRDNTPSPLGNNNKGKLDTIKSEEPAIKMEIDQDGDGGDGSGIGSRPDSVSGTGKNSNNDMTGQIKTEIKQEPMDECSGDTGNITIKVIIDHVFSFLNIYSAKCVPYLLMYIKK